MPLSKAFYFITFYNRLSAVNNNVYKTFILKVIVYQLQTGICNLS
jgi:hypothetical protein